MLRFDNISSWPRTMIIAHRGAGHHGPTGHTCENTLEAFDTAVAIGADAIELDIRRTADGVMVVHHNAAVRGTRLKIGQSSFETVRRRAASAGYAVPTLEDTLKRCAGKIALDIELKEAGYEDALVTLVSKHYEPAHIAFTSFYDDAIIRIREIEPRAVTGLLIGGRSAVSVGARIGGLFSKNRIRVCRPDFIAPHWRLLRLRPLNTIAKTGPPLVTWTLNNTPYAARLTTRGIAGIITNVPEKLLPLVGPRNG